MSTTIGTLGSLLPALMRRGATFGPFPVLLKDSAGAAVNMTGSVVTAKLFRYAEDTVPVAIMDVTVPGTAETSFTFGMTDAATALLSVGPSLDSADSLYHYRVDWRDAGGVVRPVVYGPVKVQP